MHRLKFVTWMLVLILYGVAVCPTGATAQKQVVVRTEYDVDSHGHIYLPVRLNDKIDTRFMLDTGSRTYLSDALVARMGLKIQPERDENGKERKYVTGEVVQTATLDIALKNTLISFSEETEILPDIHLQNMGATCDGILGMDTLSQLIVYLNPNSRQIAFVGAGKLSAETLRQLQMEKLKPVALTAEGTPGANVLVEMPNGLKVPMLVDLGSEFTRLPSGMAHKVSNAWKPGAKLGTAEGVSQAYIALLDQMKVGEAEVHNQRAVYTDGSSDPPLLGRDFLSRFAILLDFPGKKAYFKPLNTSPEISPFVRRRLGQEGLLPAHIVTFPYGGKMAGPTGESPVTPGASMLLTAATDITQYTIMQNLPPAGAYRKPIELEIDTANGAILLPATVEGKPVRMVLDTGSISSWMSPKSADRVIKEQVGETIQIGQAKAKSVVFNNVTLSEAAPDFLAYCNGYVADKPLFYRLTDSPIPANADGILGLDFLSTQVFGLDMEQHKMTVWPIASPNADRLRWVTNGAEPSEATMATISLTHEVDDWFYTSVTVGWETLKMVIDTGLSGAGRLPDSVSLVEYSLTLKPTSGATHKGVRGSAEMQERDCLLKMLRMGNLTLQSLSVKYVPSQQTAGIPILGMAAFKGRRILFDLPGKTIYVSRKPMP